MKPDNLPAKSREGGGADEAQPYTECDLAARQANGVASSTTRAFHNSECDLLSSLRKSMMTTASKAMGTRTVAAESKRVLIVDDDIELLLMYEALLQAHEYQTTTAENGVQALERIRHVEVDAIICDLDMPEMSGDLLHAEIGQTWPGLVKRFLFVTGNASNPIYEDFLKRTKPKVLAKPFSMELLLAELHAVLDLRATN